MGKKKQYKRKKIQEKLAIDESSSSEDEFEKEMMMELNETMKSVQESIIVGSSMSELSKISMLEKTNETEFYNKEYFDSDSDEEATSEEKKQMKRPVLTNDELLYDPNQDDQDQNWVDKIRSNYQKIKNSDAIKPKTKNLNVNLPMSDAVLNCPGCMSLLCLDCQRHEIYNCQYRAMFVKNCTINHDEILRHPKVLAFENSKNSLKKQKRLKKKMAFKNRKNGINKNNIENEFKVHLSSEMNTESVEKNNIDCISSNMRMSREKLEVDSDINELSENNADDDIYHPVVCSLCNTEIAVFDKDEVFHFYNVLASYA